MNERLLDGEGGQALVEWLNRDKAVQQVLARYFDGAPITEQNLSEWRQGGYQDWLAQRDTVDAVNQVSEQATDVLCLVNDEERFSDHLSVVLSAELARATKALLSDQDYPPKRWQRLTGLTSLLNNLRRGDLQASRLELQNNKWLEQWRMIEEDRFEKEQQKKESRASLLALAQQMTSKRAAGTARSDAPPNPPGAPNASNVSNPPSPGEPAVTTAPVPSTETADSVAPAADAALLESLESTNQVGPAEPIEKQNNRT